MQSLQEDYKNVINDRAALYKVVESLSNENHELKQVMINDHKEEKYQDMLCINSISQHLR